MALQKNATKKELNSYSDDYAIVETSGKQVWFQKDRYYDLDRLDNKVKDSLILESVLLLKNGTKTTIGNPYVKNAKVELEVISHLRDKKIVVYKMRPKKKTRKKMGHRQELTRVMVKSITIGSTASTKKASAASTTSTKKASAASTTSTKKSTTTKKSSTTKNVVKSKSSTNKPKKT